jgi:hypothetical protein
LCSLQREREREREIFPVFPLDPLPLSLSALGNISSDTVQEFISANASW